jgi:hypothetical protein
MAKEVGPMVKEAEWSSSRAVESRKPRLYDTQNLNPTHLELSNPPTQEVAMSFGLLGLPGNR